MKYRHLGKAGIRISELSLGAWVTYGGQVGEDVTLNCMKAAYEAGVNFFDNAETYANGKAEIAMGNVLKKVGWARESYVISTKIFWGGEGPNDEGLSYKHIVEGVNKALRRLQQEYVDFVFCHRPDPETPIEETVRAMDLIIRQGKAFYWGTSEWSAADILRADGLARQYALTPPSMEQP
jgi:voltage-dependent potassium channel beta subunit